MSAGLRFIASAVLAGLLIGAALAWLDWHHGTPAREWPRTAPGSPVRPAPWEVAELMEEARRITGEAL